MTDRQKNLLNLVIKKYIDSAEPVGSNFAVAKGKFKLSPATIRNEMAELEKQGYIYQPHTSAGRVPTEKGYRFYIKNLLAEKELKEKDEKPIKKVLQQKAGEEKAPMKNLAKILADISEGTVVVGFSPDNFFYTGLSNLFSQPEFQSQELVSSISSVIDRMDDVMSDFFNDMGNDVEVLVGKDNPFSPECSAIVTKISLTPNEVNLLAILGPMRMDYEENIALINFVRDFITSPLEGGDPM